MNTTKKLQALLTPEERKWVVQIHPTKVRWPCIGGYSHGLPYAITAPEHFPKEVWVSINSNAEGWRYRMYKATDDVLRHVVQALRRGVLTWRLGLPDDVVRDSVVTALAQIEGSRVQVGKG